MKSKITSYFPPLAFFLFILWMVWSADTNHKNFIMDIGHSVPFGDKIGHFLLFGILALLMNTALKFRKTNLKYRTFHLGSLLVFAFAAIEECSQLAFQSRTFDLVDVLFDLLGIGLLSSISFRRYLVYQLRRWVDYLSMSLQVD
ncbi:VanZ family protein [Reichenbachiella ulvae]|uniref:VanZ family protein n=1 Tax=Reichenbachiella ulvae TaxID=2980104 RepID=A0ABT3CQN5_9BACT|nr:VanZ family protein [Reichenbachiella ulvae]MCV9385937.1 VanZ family protein [Reichenbachiella ulvae]